MMYDRITQEELNTMSLDNGITPNFTYEKSVTDEDTGEITYINLTIHKSAEEVYQEWLYNKDNPPVVQPTLEHKITLLEEKICILEAENAELTSLVTTMVLM